MEDGIEHPSFSILVDNRNEWRQFAYRAETRKPATQKQRQPICVEWSLRRIERPSFGRRFASCELLLGRTTESIDVRICIEILSTVRYQQWGHENGLSKNILYSITSTNSACWDNVQKVSAQIISKMGRLVTKFHSSDGSLGQTGLIYSIWKS